MPLRTSALVTLLALFATSVHAGDPVPNVVTVTNTDDAGPGSLRQALLDATTTPGSEIRFAISGDGVHTISPATPLPPVTFTTTIDGSTQPGASCAGAAPDLRIEIDGGSLASGEDALFVGGSDVAIRGLVVNSAPRNGIHVGSVQGFRLTCSLIGTDATGTLDFGNGENGVWLDGTGGAQIGGTAAGDGNWIASNTLSGIVISASASENRIQGNRIGLSTAGAPLPNGGSGVLVEAPADGNEIGTLDGGNTIHHNDGGGVTVAGDEAIENAIRGNSLAGNASIGIDLLGEFFEDANDPGDPDVGPNRLQNTPVLERARQGDVLNVFSVTFSVDTDPANATYPLAIDFYVADADDEEGLRYLDTVSYSAADFAAGSVTRGVHTTEPVDGQRIVATATDALGNTSEFSDDAVTVPEPAAWAASLVALGAVAFRRRA